MTLSRDQWYVRLFFWVEEELKPAFYEKSRFDIEWGVRRSGGMNLCYFMRALLVHLPLIALSQVMLVALPLATLAMSFVWYDDDIVIDLFAFLVWFGLIFVTVFAAAWFLAKSSETIRGWFNDVEEHFERKPSFYHVTKTWLLAKKKKICPMITFE